jgi:hypothetical protein
LRVFFRQVSQASQTSQVSQVSQARQGAGCRQRLGCHWCYPFFFTGVQVRVYEWKIEEKEEDEDRSGYWRGFFLEF